MFAGAHKYQSRPCECSRGQKSVSRGQKGASKAVRVPIGIVREPKEAARVYNTLRASTTLSQP